ncbi:MAG TPA: PAS domain-containing protein [Gemmatimonadales bacterium]|nr:PAS domain-containing protein [Gemmatimonadales bacterium]
METIRPAPFPIGRFASWSQEPIGTGPIRWTGFESLLGAPEASAPAEFEGFVAHLHPDDRAKFVEVATRNMATTEPSHPFSSVFRLLRADGEVLWVASVGVVEPGADGSPGRMWGTLLDITAARRQVLTERSALGSGGAAWWTWQPADDAFEWSRDLGPLFGQPAGYAPASIGEFLALLHPEDVPVVQAQMGKVEEGSRGYDVEFRVTVAGETRWLHTSVVVERDLDGVQRYLGLTRDVTRGRAGLDALVESAERFRLVAQYGGDAISIHGRDSTYEYVSPAAGVVAGWDPQALIGTNPYDHVHPDDVERVRREVTEPRLRGERFLPMVELRYRGQDGSYRPVEVSITPITEADGTNRGFVAISRDISRRIAREAEARDREKARAVATLVGGIAHHFNNHLAAIRIHADLLALTHPAGTAERGWIDHITLATEHAGTLSRQLLTFTRQGMKAPVTRPLDALLAELMPALTVRASAGGHHLSLLPGAPGLAVHVDEREFGIALHELVANACDAMGHGGTVEIATDEDAAGVRIQVRDHGPGLSEAARQRLFEPFFSTKEFGRGLGLSVARAIVEAAKGSIRVESEAGHGVTCTIRLPRVFTPAAARAAPARVVLVVDDDAPVLQAMAQGLRSAGYEAIAAATPEAAIAELDARDGRVDVILADYIMPVMRGDELLRVVAVRWPAIRTVIVSGFIDDDRVRGLLLEQGTAFVQKPVSLRSLVAAVEEQFARP